MNAKCLIASVKTVALLIAMASCLAVIYMYGASFAAHLASHLHSFVSYVTWELQSAWLLMFGALHHPSPPPLPPMLPPNPPPPSLSFIGWEAYGAPREGQERGALLTEAASLLLIIKQLEAAAVGSSSGSGSGAGKVSATLGASSPSSAPAAAAAASGRRASTDGGPLPWLQPPQHVPELRTWQAVSAVWRCPFRETLLFASIALVWSRSPHRRPWQSMRWRWRSHTSQPGASVQNYVHVLHVVVDVPYDGRVSYVRLASVPPPPRH